MHKKCQNTMIIWYIYCVLKEKLMVLMEFVIIAVIIFFISLVVILYRKSRKSRDEMNKLFL
jgi:hypothetical protein